MHGVQCTSQITCMAMNVELIFFFFLNSFTAPMIGGNSERIQSKTRLRRHC